MHCVVKNCQSIKTKNENSNFKIILHSFPKDQNLRNKWLLVLGIREEDFCKNWKVCSLHFSENHYKCPQSLGRRLLKDFAFPTQKLNINNSLYVIKKKHDVSIIPESEVEFQTNLQPQENLSLNRKPLQSKPQILSIFPLSDSFSNEIQEISKIQPEDSISIDFELLPETFTQKLDDNVNITTFNNFNITSSKDKNFANISPFSPENKFVKAASKVEDKSIKKVLSDSDAKKIILKNKDLRNELKKRYQTIGALNQKIFRKKDKITYLEKTIVEIQKQFGIIKC